MSKNNNMSCYILNDKLSIPPSHGRGIKRVIFIRTVTYFLFVTVWVHRGGSLTSGNCNRVVAAYITLILSGH